MCDDGCAGLFHGPGPRDGSGGHRQDAVVPGKAGQLATEMWGILQYHGTGAISLHVHVFGIFPLCSAHHINMYKHYFVLYNCLLSTVVVNKGGYCSNSVHSDSSH